MLKSGMEKSVSVGFDRLGDCVPRGCSFFVEAILSIASIFGSVSMTEREFKRNAPC